MLTTTPVLVLEPSSSSVMHNVFSKPMYSYWFFFLKRLKQTKMTKGQSSIVCYSPFPQVPTWFDSTHFPLQLRTL